MVAKPVLKMTEEKRAKAKMDMAVLLCSLMARSWNLISQRNIPSWRQVSCLESWEGPLNSGGHRPWRSGESRATLIHYFSCCFVFRRFHMPLEMAKINSCHFPLLANSLQVYFQTVPILEYIMAYPSLTNHRFVPNHHIFGLDFSCGPNSLITAAALFVDSLTKNLVIFSNTKTNRNIKC